MKRSGASDVPCGPGATLRCGPGVTLARQGSLRSAAGKVTEDEKTKTGTRTCDSSRFLDFCFLDLGLGLLVVGGSGKVGLLLRVRLPGAGSAAARVARWAARVCIVSDFPAGFVGRQVGGTSQVCEYFNCSSKRGWWIAYHPTRRVNLGGYYCCPSSKCRGHRASRFGI